MVLRDEGRFSAPLSAERGLVESAKGESMWEDLYESGVFESMEFRALGYVEIENLWRFVCDDPLFSHSQKLPYVAFRTGGGHTR